MNNFRAIMLMLLAMLGFTLEDTFIKLLSKDISVGLILVYLGIGGAIIFAIMVKSKNHRFTNPSFWTPILLFRATLEGGAAIAFISSIALVEISTVAAVFQATPLVITMGAALFLGETVGWRRWAAIIVGFIGVMIIIRPGMSAFDPNVLLVLVAVMCVATRDLITRGLHTDMPASVVSFQAYLAVIPAGVIVMLMQSNQIEMLDATQSILMILAIIAGVVGYYGIVTAMRTGETSVIMPFRYMRLVLTLIVGYAVFHERPDMWTLLGAAIVIATGIYTVWRERRLAMTG